VNGLREFSRPSVDAETAERWRRHTVPAGPWQTVLEYDDVAVNVARSMHRRFYDDFDLDDLVQLAREGVYRGVVRSRPDHPSLAGYLGLYAKAAIANGVRALHGQVGNSRTGSVLRDRPSSLDAMREYGVEPKVVPDHDRANEEADLERMLAGMRLTPETEKSLRLRLGMEYTGPSLVQQVATRDGAGDLKRGRGRGRHHGTKKTGTARTHDVGQKRFENREAIIAERLRREAARVAS
jgi:hypothetical protein